MTDVLIVGAGTAGLTAAIYAVRAGLQVEVIEQTIYGGQIITTTSIENYPGMPGVSGADFASALYKQAQDLGAKMVYQSIKEVDLAGNIKKIRTSNQEKTAKTVIIATGAKPRMLDCPGEEAFTGRGVSYCATCDGAFYKGKQVAVIGGGNTAIEDVILLSGLCKKVYCIHRREEFRAEKHALELARSKPNVTFITGAAVTEITGDTMVKEIGIQNISSSSKQTMAIDGVFIAIGSVPDNRVFAHQVTIDDTGYIVAGEDCKTNLPGVFVAGDTRTKTVRQIITAAADGAVAALGAADYITNLSNEFPVE